MRASQSERIGGSQRVRSVRHIGSLVKAVFREAWGREMNLGIASWERVGGVGGRTGEAGVERGIRFRARARVVGRKKGRIRLREEREKSIVSA